MALRVLLGDDHPMFIQGLADMLDQEEIVVVSKVFDGREAVRQAEKHRPDVAVLDLAMPLLNGIDAVREIGKVSPGTKTILLTMFTKDQYVIDALRAGVSGYLLKTRAAADLVQAIREVSRGAFYLSSGIPREILEAYMSSTDAPSEPLSSREAEVLQLIAEGKAMKEIAGILGISVKTVETHRLRLMEKLGIHETAGLVRYAIRHGVIQA